MKELSSLDARGIKDAVDLIRTKMFDPIEHRRL
jgi:hypothetical protein